MNNTINYILIILGGLVAFYAQAGEQQNEYLLIGGVVFLMIGIYRVARTIPSKTEDEERSNENNIKNN